MQFSTALKASKQPRKQRAYRRLAPLHIKQKLVGAHLSKTLREKYHIRSVSVRKGDKVIVMRGSHAKKTGTVDQVSLKDSTVIISGITVTKKEGSSVPVAIAASKIMITDLNLDDKKRRARIERNSHGK